MRLQADFATWRTTNPFDKPQAGLTIRATERRSRMQQRRAPASSEAP
jgi:hypothetical protein